MGSTQAVEIVSSLPSNDKVVPLSKQRIAEARHQPTPKTTFVSLTGAGTVEQRTAMIVHDMRSPLCVVLNVLKACRKIPLDPLEQTRLTLALEEAERLTRMTDEILSHSRLTHEPMVVDQEIRLMGLIHEVIQLLTALPIAADRQILFMPNSFEGIVKGDRDKLKQVFLNLLINACEAVDSGDAITIHTQLDSRTNQLSIQVHNAGQPIPLHVLSALGHQPITTKSSGHGLGLIIVREIIEAHEGVLEIKSSPQQGTTVCVRLPLVQGASNLQPPLAIEINKSPMLSGRELEVLQLLVEGHSNPEIAQALFISMNTVKTHICNLMNKLGAEGRTQVVVKALRMGLVQ